MRRLVILGVVVAVCTCAVAFLPGSAARAANGNLFAVAYADNLGPLTECTASPCPTNSYLNWFLYVANGNRPVQFLAKPDRSTVPNAFVVGSITGTISVNGVPVDFSPFPVGGAAITPPPPSSSVPGSAVWSGHWPVSLHCFSDGTCPDIQSPAVLPGENTAVLYGTWAHGAGELDGVYVFSFVIHGTLNGTPIDLPASTPPIFMGA